MTFSANYQEKLIGTLSKLDTAKVEQAIDWLRSARDAGHHIFVCGNGGSASTASHFACDIVKGASYRREQRFRILSLNDSLPTMTAYANDCGYEVALVEQLKNFAQPGDLVMAISGSGNSPNVLRVLEYANEAGCKTMALTGRDGGKLGPLAQLHINVPEQHMGRIEDAHMVICHMIGYAFMES